MSWMSNDDLIEQAYTLADEMDGIGWRDQIEEMIEHNDLEAVRQLVNEMKLIQELEVPDASDSATADF